MPLDRNRAEALTDVMALLRMSIGACALLAPRTSGRILFAQPVAVPSAAVAIRMFGGRDLAIGLGTLLASRRDPSGTRGWVEAGGLADAVDAVALLGDTDATLRRSVRLLGGATALFAAAASPVLARAVARD
jgi:hypothetical protein